MADFERSLAGCRVFVTGHTGFTGGWLILWAETARMLRLWLGVAYKNRLCGKDSYSASKAAAEIIATSYAATLAARGNGCRIATARGGNIIGGGDWSRDRIVPDFARAVAASQELTLRRPNAVRPWQCPRTRAWLHGAGRPSVAGWSNRFGLEFWAR
ncbi:MAG: hypothetical protein ACOY5F_20770 [Pseudomonadota bacterium]